MDKFSEKIERLSREAKDVGNSVEHNVDKKFWRKIYKILAKTARYIKVWETSR